jgi:hypothetical protein
LCLFQLVAYFSRFGAGKSASRDHHYFGDPKGILSNGRGSSTFIRDGALGINPPPPPPPLHVARSLLPRGVPREISDLLVNRFSTLPLRRGGGGFIRIQSYYRGTQVHSRSLQPALSFLSLSLAVALPLDSLTQ